MFSPDIVSSDAFLEMPTSSRELYFQLGMNADDDGFVNPKKIMRMIGAGEDDLKVLLAKRFLLPFESGVVVIKHWRIHNQIRKDRYKATRYLDERGLISLKDNGSYTELATNGQPLGNQQATQVRLGKVRLGKNTSAPKRARVVKKVPEYSQLGAEVVKAFEEVDSKNKTYYANSTQRKAADFLVSEYGLERVLKIVGILTKANEVSYFPTITSPYDLKEKWAKLQSAMVRKNNEGKPINKGRGVAE